MPEVYEFLEAERIKYAIRLPANQILQHRIGELYPRVGFIVTNLSRPADRVVAFYNKRGTCEQWIKEGEGAIKWTRLSCRTFAVNAVRLQFHALATILATFSARLQHRSQSRTGR
jgi:Transposase DDE domain group 1